MDLLQWFIIFFVKKSKGGAVRHEIMLNQQFLDKCTNKLLINLKSVKYIHLLEITYGVRI